MADPSGEDCVRAFQLDQYGVNLELSLTPRPPGMWTQIANGEKSIQYGKNGIVVRGGLVTFHDDALAGPVMAMAAVPLGSKFDTSGITPALLVGVTNIEPQFFERSTDGSTWTAVDDPDVESSNITKLQGFTRDGVLYYVGSGDPALYKWTGATRLLAFDVDGAGYPLSCSVYVAGIWFFAGTLTGGGFYAVYEWHPTTGVVQQLGSPISTSDVAFGITGLSYNGQVRIVFRGDGESFLSGSVWVLTGSGWVKEYQPSNAPPVYGALDRAITVDGDLYVVHTRVGESVASTVVKGSAGSYSTVFTAPNTDDDLSGLAFQGSHWFVVVQGETTGHGGVIYCDGASELEIDSLTGSTDDLSPCQSVVWNGDLYWVFNGDASWLLKRTAAGVWSARHFTDADLNGFIGVLGEGA